MGGVVVESWDSLTERRSRGELHRAVRGTNDGSGGPPISLLHDSRDAVKWAARCL